MAFSPDANQPDADFGKKITTIISNGFTSVAISIGVSLGLFELIADSEQPMTTQEIADKGGFKERYIREWIGGVVAAGLVEITSDEPEKFFISKTRAPYLDRRRPEGFPSMMAGHLVAISRPYDELLKCFRKDGPRGISLQTYGETGVDQSRGRLTILWCQKYLGPEIVDNIPDLHNHLDEGIEVLDVACGSGKTTTFLAEKYPSSTFTGFDLSDTAIKCAQSTQTEQKLQNVSFVCCDAINLPKDWTSRFDFILVRNVVHDLPFPDKALSECYRTMKKGSYMSIVDHNSHNSIRKNVTMGDSSYRYVASLLHCMSSSLAPDGGFGLGNMSGNDTLKKLMEGAGFKVENTKLLSDNRVLFVCQKP